MFHIFVDLGMSEYFEISRVVLWLNNGASMVLCWRVSEKEFEKGGCILVEWSCEGLSRVVKESQLHCA